MNRNVESHFAERPTIDIQRSILDRSFTHKTSFDVADLVPFFVDEVLPGDTFHVTTSKVIRLQTLLTPVMDNLYLDTYYFFVPNRLVWEHWKEFCGENNSSPWVPSTTYTIPSISSPASTGFATGTIADYMGLPVGVVWSNSASRRPSALPFRAYAKIANDFFRDENLTDPLNIPIGDSNQTGTNGSSYINDVANGGKPFKVAKYHDYFTSCLPSAQKAAQPVTFPLISGTEAPVYAGDDHTRATGINKALHFTKSNDSNFSTTSYYQSVLKTTANSPVANLELNGASFTTSSPTIIKPVNLWADLSTSVGAVSINQLRLAFQLQKYYEKMAIGGSRYNEWLMVNFGTTSPDASLQRPQYLGGNRIPVTVHEVTNSAQTSTDFLGDLGAMSVTSDVHEDFVQSFTEHGFVIGVCCLRYDHSYPQGLERFWSRKSITDYYLPVFANLGEQPVYKCEIYCDATTINDNSVFGFQEAWGDYRYKPDRVSGEMRPGIANTLASWHFADYYTSAPTLSDAWIREDKTNVDRTLAVTSANANQAFMDIYVKNICTRAMPVYSIPGLIDHH